MFPRRATLAFAFGLALSLTASAGAGRLSAQGKVIRIVIDQIAFAPLEVRATVGDTIEWINKDAVDHTATSKAGGFNVVIKTKKIGRTVVKKAGTFDYYCEYHPNMTGRLVVAARKGSGATRD